MICEMRNKIVGLGDWIMTGEASYLSKKKKVGLGDIIVNTVVTFSLIIFVSWWMVPLRTVLRVLDLVQFKLEER